MNNKKLFTPEQELFIKENASENSGAELSRLFNEKFNTEFSLQQFRSYLTHYHIKYGTSSKRDYTEEEIRFLKENITRYSRKEILARFNKKFKPEISFPQLKRIMKKEGLYTGRTGRLICGHTLNQKPIGSEKVWTVSERKYIGIKTGNPSIWQFKHVYMYESAYGKVPDDKIVIFLDGNTMNTELDNLMAIDKRINVIMNQRKLPRSSKEQTLASIQLAKVITGIVDAEKRL